MRFFNINSSLLESVGWTILHSFWIITVVAAILFIALRFLGKTSAQFRYRISLFSISLSVLLVLGVLLFEFSSIKEQQDLIPSEVATSHFSNDLLPIIYEQENEASFSLPALVRWIKSNASIFAQVWMLGVLIMAVRFLGSYLYLSRLRKGYTEPINLLWTSKLNRLAQGVKLNTTPEIKASRLISSPITLGFFKPLILLPIGMIDGLSTKELESILVHELYHIKRHDFLINLFQSLIEVVLFYHPAIWWMSGVIRQEREHCCDDQTVAFTGNAIEYAKALTTVQLFHTSSKPALSMAAIGQHDRFSARIFRLFQIQERPSGPKGIISLMLLAIVFCAFSILEPNQNLTSSVLNKIEQERSDSIHTTNRIKWTADMVEVVTLSNGNKKLRLENAHTFEVSQFALDKGPILYIDGQKIESQEQLKDLDPTKIQFITSINDERDLENYGQSEQERGMVLVETLLPQKQGLAEWPSYSALFDSTITVSTKRNSDGLMEVTGSEKALEKYLKRTIKNSYQQSVNDQLIEKNQLALVSNNYKVEKSTYYEKDTSTKELVHLFVLKGRLNLQKVDSMMNMKLVVNPNHILKLDTTTIKEKAKIRILSNDEPLYVIDGKMVSKLELAKMSPNQIDKVTVIKGVKAIEIYGQGGENGVILIESKNYAIETEEAETLIYKASQQQLLKVSESYSTNNQAEEFAQPSITVYPNPTSKEFKVDFEVSKTESNVSVTIYDSNGVRKAFVEEKKYKKGKHTFEYFHPLQKGVYIIEVKIDDDTHRKRLVIE